MNEGQRLEEDVRRLQCWAFALLAFFPIACTPGNGTVSGTVSYQGTPVVFGTVLIVGSDGLPRYGDIDVDGSYLVTDLPAGPARVAVNSPDPAEIVKLPAVEERLAKIAPLDQLKNKMPQSRSDPPAQPALNREKWFPIPARYGDPETSALTCAVTKGTSRFDIALR